MQLLLLNYYFIPLFYCFISYSDITEFSYIILV